jgi:hypothetical protein
MKTKIVIAAAWLGLLMWAEPASAQNTRTYSLSVGHHESIELADDQVDKILAEASKVLRKCNVVLKRKGPVGTFSSSRTPLNIRNAADRDAVNRENFDIKVVALPIEFCRVEQTHEGCAWDPPPPPARQVAQHRSMIVSELQSAKVAGMIWAHEFGHRTGLPHRSDRNALMACQVPIERETGELTERECNCFRGGPGSCAGPAEPAEQCSIVHRSRSN